MRDKEKALAEDKRKLDEQVADQVASQLKTERARVAAEEAKKAKAAAANELEGKARELAELQDVLKVRDAKLAEAQKAQAELIKKQRELDDARRELDLTIEKRVQEGLTDVRTQAKREAEDGMKLRVAEKDQTIASMQQKIEELKQKAEQGSQQLQGEVLELELEHLLRTKFPFDLIEPVPKGEFGGDALHRINSPSGMACGTILWESKRTRNWSDGWLAKLREDQRTAKAEVLARIRRIWESARTQAARSVNTAHVCANWLIGQQIVEAEQAGARRAGYGSTLLEALSKRLATEYGAGFSVSALRYMRLFFQAYPELLQKHHAVRDESGAGLAIHHAPRDEFAVDEAWRPGQLNASLAWTHYRALLKVARRDVRDFYEIESVRNGWSARQLERQIDSFLFERLAKSRDKKGVLALANEGQTLSRPQDAIKDPYVLEFLGLPESHRLVESRIEEALINQLQDFLLELGSGFAFIGRQKRLTLDGDHFYPDLVFYHVKLKCYVVIDLKVGKLHEATKVELQTYARSNGAKEVKPFMLVIARDTTHAGQLLAHLQSDAFFSGRYRNKVIQVDSSKTGAEEEEMVRRLLAVESVDEPTEIVIHVNMLKEGWDVTNLYTIVPLRAANARTLVEQSIGRGLRLPYGRRTGVAAVDRLNIIAHDRFQEIIDDANRADSPIRLKQIVLDAPDAGDGGAPQSVSVRPNWEDALGGGNSEGGGGSFPRPAGSPAAVPLFTTEPERQVAKLAMEAAAAYELRPQDAPTRQVLLTPEVQASITETVKAQLPPLQASLVTGADTAPEIDLADVVRRATESLVRQTIDIPRIAVVPKGEVTSGFRPFTLDVSGLHLQPKDRSLVGQALRTHEQFTLSAQRGRAERRLEDYIVHALIDLDDIDYGVHAGLLYEFAGQVVVHLRSYLSDENEVRNVLDLDRKLIAANIHAQMMGHFFETATEYAVEVRRGFTALRAPTYTVAAGQLVRDYRGTVDEPSRIKQMLFGGFSRCLYPVQKFDSDTERRFAVILERDAEKWFKPAKGQFQIYYKLGAEHPEYVPDFVAETPQHLLLCETKARNEMGAEDVKAKAEAGSLWCRHASEHAAKIGAKPWRYLLIPHEQVTEDKRALDFLQFEIRRA